MNMKNRKRESPAPRLGRAFFLKKGTLLKQRKKVLDFTLVK